MADEQRQQAPPATRGIASVALSKFWPGSPANWFCNVEAQFAVRGVTDPVDKYYLVMAALTEPLMDLLDGLVPDEPDETSYATIKRALVAMHKLTAYQQVDRLMAMEPLGGRKPSELLAAMKKLRPASDDAFFAWAFLQRLPREIRVLLARDDHTDMRAVTEKADDLVAVHQPKHHDAAIVAAVAAPAAEGATGDEEDTVAAATSAAWPGN
jgi:hypothetical protein